MKLRENRVLGIAVASLVLVGGANLAVYAANGKPLLLGQGNSATKTTTVTNKKGTALSLNSKKSAPPLAVNSSKVVKNLNADQLDGKSAADFVSATLVWQNVPFDADGDWALCTAYEFEAPQYAVQGDVVYLRGGVCNGSVNALLRLPPNAAPDRTVPNVEDPIAIPLIVVGEFGPATLNISSNGEIVYVGVGDKPEYISLEGVAFTR